MPSKANTKLAKLAVGIASAAALAGLAGRFSTDSAAQVAVTPEGERSEEQDAAPGRSVPRRGDKDKKWGYKEGEHDGKHHYDRFLARPERRWTEADPESSVPRARTGAS